MVNQPTVSRRRDGMRIAVAPIRWKLARQAAWVLFVVLMTARQVSASDLSGSWKGYWQNSNNRHTGPIRATFVKLDESRYRVHFTGRFFKVLPFHYTVVLNVVESTGDSVRLEGSQYVGRRFGTFRYTADATDCDFAARYTSCKFQGKFVMTRCTRCGSACIAAAGG